MTREEVKLETKLDPLLQKVITAISLNNSRLSKMHAKAPICDMQRQRFFQ